MQIALLSAFIYAITNFLKHFRAANWNAVITQVVVWVAGVVAVLLFTETDFAAGLEIQGVIVGDADFYTKLFVGLMASSFATVGYDVKSALDNSDSAKTPRLVDGEGGAP